MHASMDKRVSSGHKGFDTAIDMLRLGDNVVWQVQSLDDYRQVLERYITQAKCDQRRLVYFRFGSHEPLMSHDESSVVYTIDASEGFESFTTKIYSLIEQEGKRAFYVFDCLSDLLQFWYSDLMIGNFFRVTCPFLFQLDTIAYFAIIRGVHTHSTIARIRETTQLLLDTYSIDQKFYIHPLKVWERYSPTMFFPHLIVGDEALSLTSSADAATLFSGLDRVGIPRDYWEITLDRAQDALAEDEETQAHMKRLLITIMMGKEQQITALIDHYFSLQDVLEVTEREIGTGFIGGKSVGMLLARAILQNDAWPLLQDKWEPHDSFYLGTDVFYTYVVHNGWWELSMKQKSADGYFEYAEELREKLLVGKFPDVMREQFIRVMEHYGQSPIIVRSSSLLEDNYGNAFAGKYESVFCANQGSPEERYEKFEQAIREVYASTMSEDALLYRRARGLDGRDEQMAILVQRVSGDHYGDFFCPHIAGVGNSANLYLWNEDMDVEAGMIRVVLGLGTRAVDRVSGDYARIVALDHPEETPPVHQGDEKKFSQHNVDVLDLKSNTLSEIAVSALATAGMRTDETLFFSTDYATISWLADRGIKPPTKPLILDFEKLLSQTEFPEIMRGMLSVLEKAYRYPVDIEFAANFTREGKYRINMLQCRPQQTKGLGRAVKLPEANPEQVLFSSHGNFMGGNVGLKIDYVISVQAQEYLALSEQKKYELARVIGMLNQVLKDESVVLMGPGRWGTTTPSLGVPVHFTELSNMTALCELSYQQDGLMPELSFGSHFFQDIVESGIFYVALFVGQDDVAYNPEHVLCAENLLADLILEQAEWAQVLHVSKHSTLMLYSDIATQKVLCL